jgi:hypothetical protein
MAWRPNLAGPSPLRSQVGRVPDSGHEAMRDLVRARLAAERSLRHPSAKAGPAGGLRIKVISRSSGMVTPWIVQVATLM